ncbi:hypothetical protein [Streptomyces sp. UG1]|uniref:hypothetical protein n=1 Tax=Streptomyces sp. UG1 TaxID=3417652 RepID=UPI003CE711E5
MREADGAAVTVTSGGGAGAVVGAEADGAAGTVAGGEPGAVVAEVDGTVAKVTNGGGRSPAVGEANWAAGEVARGDGPGAVVREVDGAIAAVTGGGARGAVVGEADGTAAAGPAVGTTAAVASDGGPGVAVADRMTAPSGGTGLQALRAAVTAVGGDFEAGPYGDGFRVRAYVPEQPRTPSAPSAPHTPFTHARRRVALALVAAVGAGVVLVGGAFTWYAYTETHSVLPPAAYAELRLGASADDIAQVLPDRAVRDAPVDRAPGPPPKGSACRYYRASGELLVSVDHFRLCFDDAGRLVAKDVIPRVGLSQDTSADKEFAP